VRRVDNAPSPGGDLSLLRPVGLTDRTLGNPEAPVVIIEYSDIDCAYCKGFQETVAQIVADYAATGDVLLVYRHFPIIETHPSAALHAEAAECAGNIGGNEAFFRFIDALQQEAPGNREFNPSGYPRIVRALGLDLDAFTACTEGSEFETKVASDYDNALAAGAAGTPYTVILAQGAAAVPISGAIPYIAMKELVERAIQEAAATTP
jgi:protein-disulfide isomerase